MAPFPQSYWDFVGNLHTKRSAVTHPLKLRFPASCRNCDNTLSCSGFVPTNCANRDQTHETILRFVAYFFVLQIVGLRSFNRCEWCWDKHEFEEFLPQRFGSRERRECGWYSPREWQRTRQALRRRVFCTRRALRLGTPQWLPLVYQRSSDHHCECPKTERKKSSKNKFRAKPTCNQTTMRSSSQTTIDNSLITINEMRKWVTFFRWLRKTSIQALSNCTKLRQHNKKICKCSEKSQFPSYLVGRW